MNRKHLASTEIHTIDKKTRQGPKLPFPTKDHCLVQTGPNQLFFAGFDGTEKRLRYFTYDLNNKLDLNPGQQWIENLKGPKITIRTELECAGFESEDESLILLGIYYQMWFYNIESGDWTRGRSLLTSWTFKADYWSTLKHSGALWSTLEPFRAF